MDKERPFVVVAITLLLLLLFVICNLYNKDMTAPWIYLGGLTIVGFIINMIFWARQTNGKDDFFI